MKAVPEVLIRIRAYEIWEERGRPTGFDKEHWAEAEQQLLDAAPDIAERPLTEAVAGETDAESETAERQERPAPEALARTGAERRSERGRAAAR